MLQLALQISKSCIFLNLGFFCCFDSSTTVSELYRNSTYVCKLPGMNDWQWNAIAIKEVGEYFGFMKQSLR
jgi:hypothetical protein